MARLRTEPLYKDLDFLFQAHPETSQLMTLTNERAITQALKNLVLTNKYERLFQPNIFSGVYGMLFEPFDAVTAQLLRDSIRMVINTYEPRAEIMSITIRDDTDNNGFDATIVYKPINAPQPVTISVFLERIR